LRNQVVPESLTAPLGAEGSEPDGAPRKFATKQAKNREINRRRKLAKHHRSGAKHSPETIERIRATRIAQIAEKQREAAQPEPCRVPCSAVELYRATVAERRPIIAAREAKIMQHVKEAVDAADARAHELRHRGRPKNTHRLPPLFIRKSPDALIAAVSDWHGER
jgi:hypothetical protein